VIDDVCWILYLFINEIILSYNCTLIYHVNVNAEKIDKKNKKIILLL